MKTISLWILRLLAFALPQRCLQAAADRRSSQVLWRRRRSATRALSTDAICQNDSL